MLLNEQQVRNTHCMGLSFSVLFRTCNLGKISSSILTPQPSNMDAFDIESIVYLLSLVLHVLQMSKRWGIGETSLFTQFECSSIENGTKCCSYCHFTHQNYSLDGRCSRLLLHFERLFSNKHELWPKAPANENFL